MKGLFLFLLPRRVDEWIALYDDGLQMHPAFKIGADTDFSRLKEPDGIVNMRGITWLGVSFTTDRSTVLSLEEYHEANT